MLKDKPITREWIDKTQEEVQFEIDFAMVHPNLANWDKRNSHNRIKQLMKLQRRIEYMKRFGRLQKRDLYHSQ